MNPYTPYLAFFCALLAAILIAGGGPDLVIIVPFAWFVIVRMAGLFALLVFGLRYGPALLDWCDSLFEESSDE